MDTVDQTLGWVNERLILKGKELDATQLEVLSFAFKSKLTEPNEVWRALYNSNIHEGTMATISVHRTKAGALKAMLKHKAEELRKFQIMPQEFQDDLIFGDHEEWGIAAIKTQN